MRCSPILSSLAAVAKVVSFNISGSSQSVVEGGQFIIALEMTHYCIGVCSVRIVETRGTAEGVWVLLPWLPCVFLSLSYFSLLLLQ